MYICIGMETLSDKGRHFHGRVFDERDVKQFIKDIKNEIASTPGCDGDIEANIIDKLAGEKLV